MAAYHDGSSSGNCSSIKGTNLSQTRSIRFLLLGFEKFNGVMWGLEWREESLEENTDCSSLKKVWGFFLDFFFDMDYFKSCWLQRVKIASVLCLGFSVARHMGSKLPTRIDPAPALGGQSLHNWTTREIPKEEFINSLCWVPQSHSALWAWWSSFSDFQKIPCIFHLTPPICFISFNEEINKVALNKATLVNPLSS